MSHSGHKTVVCLCGKQLSTCRCASPNKAIVVSDKLCTHNTPGKSKEAGIVSERTIRFTGATTVKTLRALLEGAPADAEVRVTQDRQWSNTADPGGEVTVTVRTIE